MDKHTLTLSVRDYECDMLGGVHHSIFFKWFEHARAEFVKDVLKTSLMELYKKDITFVIGKQAIEYKESLYPGQTFDIETEMFRHSKHKLLFRQSITRKSRIVANFLILVVPISPKTLKAHVSDELENTLKDYPITETDLSNESTLTF